MPASDEIDLTAAVRTEIEGMHAFFVDWFRGSVAEDPDLFERKLGTRFDDAFRLIPPGGANLSRDGILNGLRSGYGGSPGFAIQIRNTEVRPALAPGIVLVTYEEWQHHAVNSTPPENGRLSSAVLLQTGNEARPFRWRHVHETWLPADVMQAGPYDF